MKTFIESKQMTILYRKFPSWNMKICYYIVLDFVLNGLIV